MKVKTGGYYPSLGHATVHIDVTDEEQEAILGGHVPPELSDRARVRFAFAVSDSIERYKKSEVLREEVEVNILSN